MNELFEDLEILLDCIFDRNANLFTPPVCKTIIDRVIREIRPYWAKKIKNGSITNRKDINQNDFINSIYASLNPLDNDGCSIIRKKRLETCVALQDCFKLK